MTLRRLILSLALVASGLACEKKEEEPSAKPSAAESPTSAKGEALYEGDLLRTQMEASAQVTLADQTLIELPEVSAIAIGDRSATAAPGVAVAALSGAARFTVPGAASPDATRRTGPTRVVSVPRTPSL